MKKGDFTELENRAGCKISIKADATLIENEYQLLVDNIPIQTKEKLVSGKNKPERSKEPHHHSHPQMKKISRMVTNQNANDVVVVAVDAGVGVMEMRQLCLKT